MRLKLKSMFAGLVVLGAVSCSEYELTEYPNPNIEGRTLAQFYDFEKSEDELHFVTMNDDFSEIHKIHFQGHFIKDSVDKAIERYKTDRYFPSLQDLN